MSKTNFIRTSSRTWVTRSFTENYHYKLREIKEEIMKMYNYGVYYHSTGNSDSAVEIKILEDFVNLEFNSLRTTLENALRNGIQSIPIPMHRQFYLQITFLNEADGADFIMKASDPSQYFNQIFNNIY